MAAIGGRPRPPMVLRLQQIASLSQPHRQPLLFDFPGISLDKKKHPPYNSSYLMQYLIKNIKQIKQKRES
jgi:hypothetical protein